MSHVLKEIVSDHSDAKWGTHSTLTDNERFDALMRLRDAWRIKWDARVTNEWRISFGVWTLLALGIARILNHDHVPWFLPALIVLLHAFILLRIRHTNARDGKISRYYLREAEQIILSKSVLPAPHLDEPLTPGETFLHYAVVAQIAASIVLCLAIASL